MRRSRQMCAIRSDWDVTSIKSDPFPHVVISHAFTDSTLLGKVEAELMEITFTNMETDLFSLHQSGDLSIEQGDSISVLVGAMYSDQFREHVGRQFGVVLNSEVDITSSVYRQGDVLLPHDDRQMNRAVAFILYLVDNSWSEKDGGILELLTYDASEIHTKIVPSRNTLALFRVSAKSWHQVGYRNLDKAQRN
jgi:Rps23 Pro-64 3,4-dihydroxylase Tpa1-like proline 4-hydroxylase